MSDPFEACFTLYHKGKFEVKDGITSYQGGEIVDIVCPPEMMFTKFSESIGSSLYGQRIWYKLPDDDFTDLKLMCNGDAMYQRLIEALIWTKAAEIFMEKDDDIGASGDGDGASGRGDRVRGDTAHNSDSEILYEDAQVEHNLAGFVDEDEHHNDELTPQNSDCEDNGPRYQRCKKGSGELKLGQAFDSISEFKEAVVDYALKSGCNVKYTRWGLVKSEVRCAVVSEVESDNDGEDGNGDGSDKNQHKGCRFRIYCSYEKSVRMFLIKTFEDEHSCISDGYSKVIKDGIIAKLFLNDIRRDPTLKPKFMQEKLEEKYKVITSHDQCRKAKKKALMMIQDEHDEQFARLKDYKVEVLKCNPDSTVEIETATNESGFEIFEKVANTIKAEKKHLFDCRVIPSGNGIYEVGENNHAHTVNMVEKTCVCRRWSMTGIPCRHALRVILKKKLDPLNYVSHWYLTSTWRKQYCNPILPVNGINFWRSPGEPTIQPPPRDVPQPTKKEKKRFKGKNESPKKKKKKRKRIRS